MDPPLSQFMESQPVLKLRPSMPEVSEPKQPSIVSMLKEVIGKDISQPLPIPSTLAEPSSEITKRAEDIEYSELLDEAAEFPRGSIDRLLKVAAFALSPYGACHANRICKPLFSSPLETLEAVYPEKGVRYLAEMIQDEGSWICAGHMEGRKWTLVTNDQPKQKLWGNSMDFIPNWFLELTFYDGEVYTWTKAITSVNNIVKGEMFVSHRGALKIDQKTTGRVATLKFKEPGMATLSTKARKIANRPVTGYIQDEGKKFPSPRFEGFWDSHLDAVYDDGKTHSLWKIHPLPENNNRYQMTHFMIGLTDLPEELKPLLPPTDSRWRRDIRLLEKGVYVEVEQARPEKERQEERMFARVKAAPKKNGKPNIKPHWFVPDSNHDTTKPGEGLRWRYNGKYWAARAAGFPNEDFPNLFND